MTSADRKHKRFSSRLSDVHIGAEYDAEQTQWLKAVSRQQQYTGRKVLDAREVLAIARQLGYRQKGHRAKQP